MNRQDQEQQAVLQVRDLTISFRSRNDWHPVVRKVSFDIAPRETLAVVGESGSGKSVTALSVMRLLPKDQSRIEGEVRLKGRDLLSLSEGEMRSVRGRDVAMIFQEPMTSLNPLFTIGRQIAEVVVNHDGLSWKQANAKALELLEKVRIPAARTRFHEYPHQFSGGMRQRAMIAMALACNPTLLIADEPTTALDATVQAQILALIRHLQEEEDMAVLFITHDMGVVAEIADRTVVMYRGDAIESGTTETIFASPREAYTRALLHAVPRLGAIGNSVLPMRFPPLDRVSGELGAIVPTIDTVQADAEPALEIKDLTVRFDVRSQKLFGGLSGRVHAVEGLNFSIQPGETLALVGESGCGKSTTGKAIMGLVKPQAGSIKVAGQELVGISAGALRQGRQYRQMIFQDPFSSLDPRMSVGQAIAEPFLVNGKGNAAAAKAEVARLMEAVGLPAGITTRYPHEFSGGQRQRICIARALILSPRLLVADEAVSALDVSVKAQVVNLLLDLQEKMGFSCLFISHDMAVVERISHRIAVMYLGEIVEIGPRKSLFEAPQHPYTRKLLAAIPTPDPTHRRRRELNSEDIPSPFRPTDYQAPLRNYLEVTPGHLVQEH
ncbi:ABC transporter ATP-binding protein [Devosia sp. A369]